MFSPVSPVPKPTTTPLARTANLAHVSLAARSPTCSRFHLAPIRQDFIHSAFLSTWGRSSSSPTFIKVFSRNDSRAVL